MHMNVVLMAMWPPPCTSTCVVIAVEVQKARCRELAVLIGLAEVQTKQRRGFVPLILRLHLSFTCIPTFAGWQVEPRGHCGVKWQHLLSEGVSRCELPIARSLGVGM